MRTTLALLLLCAAGCGQAKETGATSSTSACPAGICGGTGGAGGATSTGATGATTTGATATATSTGSTCAEAWTCTAWQPAAGGQYTRVCTDKNACGTTVGKPPEGPLSLPALDLDYYKCKVEPIFDRGCAMLGCHGTETGRALKIYARGRLRHKEMVPQVSTCPIGPQVVDLAVEGSGTVMCVGWSPHTAAEWQSNYDSARAFMLGVTDPEQSDLIAQPIEGGKAHAGVHLFAKGDPEHVTLKAWLGGAALGSPCDPGPN
jgi:hypothetical protein